MELLIDGYSSNFIVMTDKSVMRNWLMKLAEHIGMKIVGTPHVVGYPWPGSDDETALSGDCFLADSSIVVHTYPEECMVHINIFSCREFDLEKACEYIKSSIGIEHGTGLHIQRGYNPDSQVVPGLRVLSQFSL